MTIPNTKKGWQAEESGYDVTKSPEIISQTLSMLKNKRMFVVLIYKGYQSGSTILVDYDQNKLMIDKPVDWPNTEKIFRIVFKDTGKLWNHFTVKVKGVKDDLLITTRPTKISRLQRRSHFRVETPRGSTVSFKYKETSYDELELIDISAGGIQACSKERLPIPGENETINNVQLYIPPTANIDETYLLIQTGQIVRITRNENQHAHCYGITFEYLQNEEELLLKYVRQRELELLRYGFTA